MKKWLIIESSNPDWCGKWFRHDVEKEMLEFDNKPQLDTDWMEWILNHLFDTASFTDSHNRIVFDESVLSVVLNIDGYTVNIRKE